MILKRPSIEYPCPALKLTVAPLRLIAVTTPPSTVTSYSPRSTRSPSIATISRYEEGLTVFHFASASSSIAGVSVLRPEHDASHNIAARSPAGCKVRRTAQIVVEKSGRWVVPLFHNVDRDKIR